MTHAGRQPLRMLAWACVILMTIVVVASAWLRLSQPRSECIDWPGCRSAQRPPLAVAPPAWLGEPAVVATVRATHRVVATTVLLAVVSLLALAVARRRAGPAPLRGALAMLVIALALSLLGIVTPGSTSPAVLLGNLLGGLWLLALAWSVLRGLRGAPTAPRTLRRWALVASLAWTGQAAFGALSGAFPSDVLPALHVGLALPVAALAGVVGWLARRAGCTAEGTALVAVAVLQLALGAATAIVAARVPVVLLHEAAAAAGIALLGGLALARPDPHGAG